MNLRVFHKELHDHFAHLHDQRASAGLPVFALEHGLTTDKIESLQAAIRSFISATTPDNNTWLAWVVYAVEIGYEFDGREYWDSFSAQTPAWDLNGDRHFIRDSFKRFVRTFGGFEPTGRWANHFNIISFPITHAILPTDLQRQLAKVLYELRFQLSYAVLHSPEQLGQRVASAATITSKRFLQFAENSRLVGLIAKALLFHDDGNENVILPTTLQRIVGDLQLESDARSWLSEARKQVRGRTRTSNGFEGTPLCE